MIEQLQQNFDGEVSQKIENRWIGGRRILFWILVMLALVAFAGALYAILTPLFASSSASSAIPAVDQLYEQPQLSVADTQLIYSAGLRVVAGVLLSLIALIILRNNQHRSVDRGCPRCGEYDLIRIRRTGIDRFLNVFDEPKLRFACRNCTWTGRLSGSPDEWKTYTNQNTSNLVAAVISGAVAGAPSSGARKLVKNYDSIANMPAYREEVAKVSPEDIHAEQTSTPSQGKFSWAAGDDSSPLALIDNAGAGGEFEMPSPAVPMAELPPRAPELEAETDTPVSIVDTESIAARLQNQTPTQRIGIEVSKIHGSSRMDDDLFESFVNKASRNSQENSSN